ncbi:MAG TPA: hypothetical protein VFJ82_03770 [Longimicrobium sp.]|nr:hypothetical protein [Longimicrobium sp.]
MSTHAPTPAAPHDPGDSALDHRLNDIGWGLFLILMGALWLLPAGTLPDGSWLIATGALLLGLNAARRARGVPVHRVGLLLGVLALLAGVASLADLTEPVFPALLVGVGAWIVFQPLARRG